MCNTKIIHWKGLALSDYLFGMTNFKSLEERNLRRIDKNIIAKETYSCFLGLLCNKILSGSLSEDYISQSNISKQKINIYNKQMNSTSFYCFLFLSIHLMFTQLNNMIMENYF